MGDLLGEPGGGALLLGALKVMKGRLWGWVSLFIGAQLGYWSGLVYRGLWEMAERGSEGGVYHSLWELCEGNLEGSLAGDPEGHLEKALETFFSSHRGTVGEPARGLVYRGL
jgi:hypothetical protein